MVGKETLDNMWSKKKEHVEISTKGKQWIKNNGGDEKKIQVRCGDQDRDLEIMEIQGAQVQCLGKGILR